MKYKILDINNYDKIVDAFLETFKEEFYYDSTKELVMKGKDKFKEFTKPIIINELNQQLNEYPDLLDKFFKRTDDNTYTDNTGLTLKVVVDD